MMRACETTTTTTTPRATPSFYFGENSSLAKWGKQEADNDAYGRFPFGTPPKDTGDLAFVQHMIASLNSEGMMGVVVPHGVLYRGSSERNIREGILKNDLLEAVIGLPPALLYGTAIPAVILILN